MGQSARQRIEPAIAEGGGAEKITSRLADLVRDVYWKEKDLDAVLDIAQAGIEFGQRESDKLRPTDPASADKILGVVKGMHFNIASFTWPGWDEPGITITPERMQLGRESAKHNHRLAVELKRPKAKVADACWLKGVHALAAGDFAEANADLNEYFKLSDDEMNKNVARGYLAVTHLAARHDLADAERDFGKAIDALKAQGGEDATEYVRQLQVARRVFIKK